MRRSTAMTSPITADAVGALPAPVPANVSVPEDAPDHAHAVLRPGRLREGVLGAHVRGRDDLRIAAARTRSA